MKSESTILERYHETKSLLSSDETQLQTGDLLERVRAAMQGLKEAKENITEKSPSIPENDADSQLWDQATKRLIPSTVESPTLNSWYGTAIGSMMQAMTSETRRIVQLPLSPAEKWSMIPAPSHSNPVLDDEIIDLRGQHVSESSDALLRLILPQLAQATGKLWTCGGVKGSIMAAGKIDLKYLFFHAEFSRFHTINGKYPKANSVELAACQKRVQDRLGLLADDLDDPDAVIGLQFVYNAKNELDWIPLIRYK